MFAVILVILASCDNNLYIRDWYQGDYLVTATEEPTGTGSCDILGYYFIDPARVGVIDEASRSGGTDDPVQIGLWYDKDGPPEDSGIVVVHNGASYRADSGWAGEGGGVFVRSYTVLKSINQSASERLSDP
ncbi:MAG: hypothetical protein LBG27_00050 [Spirochaetaceae bacterium]|nr:hypothetical protein [Spirochaetaceae bacterium]